MDPSSPWTILDRIVGLVCASSYTLLVVGKALTGRVVYLAAPCNAMSALLLVFSVDPGSYFGEALFNWYLATSWGVLVALGTPDTRDQVYSFEYPHFFVTHALELAVPAYLLLRRQYALHTSIASTLHYFGWYLILHFGVYELVSILAEENLNYIMRPPRPLFKFGTSYRYIGVAAGFVVTLVFRHVVVAAVAAVLHWLSPQKPGAKTKTE